MAESLSMVVRRAQASVRSFRRVGCAAQRRHLGQWLLAASQHAPTRTWHNTKERRYFHTKRQGLTLHVRAGLERGKYWRLGSEQNGNLVVVKMVYSKL